MKIPLLNTLITIYLIKNIQCIQPQNQPTSYSTSNIQTQYRQIENYIRSNVAPQQSQANPEPNLFQNIQSTQYQITPNSENYYQDTNNAQTKVQNNYSQQPQLLYVKVNKPSSQVQEQNQGNVESNGQYLLREQNGNILQNSAPSNQYSLEVGSGHQVQHYPEPIQQNPIVQAQPNSIPTQQQSIPSEQYQQYTVQNQPEAVQNSVVYQPQQEQTYQNQQPQELSQNIPQQYNLEAFQENPSQTVNYPAYQQVLVNNESFKPKQSNGYKVRETPVERQTEEYAPTNDQFSGQLVRNSQLFHDLAVHGSFSNDGNIFGQLNYPTQQIGRNQVQQLSQNTYDVFSDSIQGQQQAGLSAYGASDGTPQQRLLNSGL